MSVGREIMHTVMQTATQQARSYASDVCFGEVTGIDPIKVSEREWNKTRLPSPSANAPVARMTQ